jgi:hypothetical protein
MAYEGPMPAARLAIVLPLTTLPKAKRDLVSIIGAFEGGRWLTSEDAAHELDLSDGRCRAYLRELASERVLLRDGGGADRCFWYEVSPDVGAWKVGWRVTRRELLDRVARYDVEVAAGLAKRLIARPMYARCGAVIARVISARSPVVNPQDEAMEALVSEVVAAAEERASRVKGRAKSRRLTVVPDARDEPKPSTKGVGSSPSPVDASKPVGSSSSGGEVGRHVDHGRVGRAVRDQVNANDQVRATTFGWTDSWRPKAYGPFKRYADLLDELLYDHGTEAVLGVIAHVSIDIVKVPAFLEQMRLELEAGHVDLEAGRELEIVTTRRKRESLLAIIASFDEVPGRDPRPEDHDRIRELLAQVAACDARLAELGAAA